MNNARIRDRALLCASLLAAVSCSKPGESATSNVAAAGTGTTTAGAAAATSSDASSAGTTPTITSLPTVTPAAGTRATAAGTSAAGTGGQSATAGTTAPSTAGAAASGNAGASAPDPNTNAWRMMGYDHRNWYFNPTETALSVDNANKLTELWRFTVSGFPLGSPVIADGKVFAIASGALYAIDLSTGKQIWAREDIAGSASVAFAEDSIYVQNSLPPRIYKLEAATGKTIWGPVTNCDDDSSCSGESSPIIVGDTMLVGLENNLGEASLNPDDARGGRGGVHALDAATGMQRWLYRTIPEDDPSHEDGASVWSTVAVDLETSTVYATTGNNYTVAGANGEAFHAIDLKTGTKRWVSQVRQGDAWTASQGDNQNDMDFGANPILAELDGLKLLAAGDKGGVFWAVDRSTGKILWSRSDLSPSHSAVFGGVFINGAFDGRAFYVAANDPQSKGSVLHRLEAKEGKTTWKHTFTEYMWGASSLANGLLFAPINTTLYVMNAETGDVLTKFDTGGTIAGGAPAVAQGRVIVKSGLLWGDLIQTRANDQIICYGLPSAAASGTGAAGSGAAGSGSPPSPSFSAIHREVLVGTGCTSGVCHSAAAAGGLDLSTKDTAYRNLVGIRAMGTSAAGAGPNCADSGLMRVAPRAPAASLLLQKLEHTQSCGAPMPSASTKLPTPQLDQVRAWIANGAAND